MKRARPHALAGVQVLRAVGTALAEGRVEDVKDAATLLLANSNLPGTTQQGRGRPIDLRPQLGLPPVVAGELDHTPLGQSGFEAMLNWYLAAAEHQLGHYALSANHASQAIVLLDANTPTEDHTRTNVLPSRNLLRTMASVSEVVASFHQHMHDTDVAAARQLPKRLLAALPALEGEEPTLQSIEAQMVVLFNAAVISASAGEVTEAEAAIVTLLKKAVVLHLMTGTAAINRESSPRAAKRRRTEPTKEESETKRGSTIEVVEQIAKEVVNRTGPRGMPHDRAQKEEEAWDEYRQAREMIDRIGEVCVKAVHLLAVIDLSSSNVENWKRAKRILRIIADASANNDICQWPAVDDIGSSRVALPCLRCHFPRFTVADDDGPDCGLHITHYLLGVAYYLQGKLNKAVKALEGATRGDFYEAHYLLAYVHLRLGNFAAIPKLLEPITQSEDNLLAPDCLNLVAVAHAMQNELDSSLDALRMTLDARNTGSARCSLFNLVTVFGKQGTFDDQEGAISALRQAKAHGEGVGSDEVRPPHVVPLSSQADLGSAQAAIVDAHDVSRLAIEYVSAKSALAQRDYKTALAHYRAIANTLKRPGSVDVPDSLPVDGPVVWHEYLECLLATGAHTKIAATAEFFLSLPLPEQDVSALFSVSQALFRLGKFEEALSVLERIGSAMAAAKSGKITAAPHAELRVRLNNNKAMVMARLGRHEDALNQLQAVQNLATAKDQKLEVAFNIAVLLTHMKREEDAARAWLPARGQPLDQLPSYYQRWVANVRTDSSAGWPAETSYREMDRALGEVWRKCREQQRVLEEIESVGSLAIDCFDT